MKKILCSISVVIAAAACATAKSDPTPAGQEAAASVDGGTLSLDGGAEVVNLQTGLPSTSLAPGALISFDQRGAFGPIIASHLDVYPDRLAKCFRRRALKPDENKQRTLSEEQLKAINAEIEKSKTREARPVARRGVIQDIGVVTIALPGVDGKEVTIVTDGATTVDPPQGDLMALLGAITQQCLEGELK